MRLDSAIFYTNDLDKIIEFYRDKLGLQLDSIQGDTFVSFIFENKTKLGIKKANAKREVPGSQTLILSVKDIAELYSALKEAGFNFYKELTVQNWGTNFSILDPDGNKVEFVGN